MEMAVGLDLIDSAFSQREATLCFMRSRMWCVDNGSVRARVKMANLVRCSDAQMLRCSDAQMLRCSDAQMLRCSDAEMANLVSERFRASESRWLIW